MGTHDIPMASLAAASLGGVRCAGEWGGGGEEEEGGQGLYLCLCPSFFWVRAELE